MAPLTSSAFRVNGPLSMSKAIAVSHYFYFSAIHNSFSSTQTLYVGKPPCHVGLKSIPMLASLLSDDSLNRNSTSSLFPSPPETYWGQFDEISKYNVHLNVFERLWAAWYAYLQNDVLATGIMSFVMHEAIYFGRSIPWAIIDRMSYFNKYKIQNV